MTTDNTHFEYTVKGYDSNMKIIHVVFDDGSWAKIPLPVPLPENQDQLDMVVRSFTPPKEILDARQAPVDSAAFINDLIGQTLKAERFSFYKASGQHKRDKIAAEVAASDATIGERIAAAIAADKQKTPTTPEKE